VQAVHGATGRFGDGVVGEDRRKPEKGKKEAAGRPPPEYAPCSSPP